MLRREVVTDFLKYAVNAGNPLQKDLFVSRVVASNRGERNILSLQEYKIKMMTRQAIIDRTIKAINQLPEDKAEEISDFADFLSKRYEEYQLQQGIQQLSATSKAFDFLNDEEDIYTIADLKEVYNG